MLKHTCFKILLFIYIFNCTCSLILVSKVSMIKFPKFNSKFFKKLCLYSNSQASLTPNVSNFVKGIDIYLSDHRFWTQRIQLKSNSSSWWSDVNKRIDDELLQVDSDRYIEFGIAIIFRKSENLVQLLPISKGTIDYKHIVSIPKQIDVKNSIINDDSLENDSIYDELVICGFRPRAAHDGSNYERPIDPERLIALNQALKAINSVTEEELSGEDLEGTPPSRIFRSFVAPRPKAEKIHIQDTENYIKVNNPTLSPLERAASRTAMQIEQAMRQIRADRAQYLRNTDFSLPNSSLISKAPDENANCRKLNPVVVLLDNIRSAHNVGSIFRSADAGGVSKIVTCGITCHPPNVKLRKTAFSSVDTVNSQHYEDSLTAIQELKNSGYKIIVMETTAKSHLYSEYQYPKNIVLVVGNEITGVDPRIMEIADEIVEIPSFGTKNSLNVAAALPIVLFEALRQWK